MWLDVWFVLWSYEVLEVKSHIRHRCLPSHVPHSCLNLGVRWGWGGGSRDSLKPNPGHILGGAPQVQPRVTSSKCPVVPFTPSRILPGVRAGVPRGFPSLMRASEGGFWMKMAQSLIETVGGAQSDIYMETKATLTQSWVGIGVTQFLPRTSGVQTIGITYSPTSTPS